jgi:hypothetical protein
MEKRIVFTRYDGGVSVCCPAQEVLRWMCVGGLWGGLPRGFVEAQTERQIAEGRRPDAVRRFIRAVLCGGCSTAEALAIIRDRDCGHRGTGFELWDVADIPADRWFRDAWHRSQNGGPIEVSLKKAKPIQFERIKTTLDLENARRASDIALFDQPIVLDWGRLRDQIQAADDVNSLRRIWPFE